MAWLAAHVPEPDDSLRLKKCKYIDTNISETVDLIMDSDRLLLPISATMLGVIRVGVVRIYLKKLEHLCNDYKKLRKQLEEALTIPQLDLPEDKRKAPVELITFPQTLNLEDDTVDMEFDNHFCSEEDVDFADQIPTGVDPYVAITFDEDIIPESNQMDVDQVTVPVSENLGETDVEMDYEAGRNNELGKFNVALDTGAYRPSNLSEPLNPTTERRNTSSPGCIPEIEKRRDAAHALSPVSHPSYNPQQHNVRVELTEPLDETLKVKEPDIPSIDEEVLDSRGHSTFELRLGSPCSAGSEEERANFVHPSPELVLQPTTPPPPPQTRPRKRKRKHYDKATVLLSNKIMKKRLEDPSNTVRKRKKLPSSRVGLWRLDNQSKKDQLFNEPLFTGFSNVLRSLFDKDYVASKPYLAVTDETCPQPASSPTREAETEINPASPVPQSPVPDSTKLDNTVQRSPGQQTEDVQGVASPHSVHEKSVAAESQSPQSFNNDDDMEIERFRNGGFPNYMPSPPTRPSLYRSDDFTTQPDTWETGSYRTKPSTYRTEPNDLPGQKDPGVSAIPEMTDEELYFLELGGNTPVRSPNTQDSYGLSGRTRDVAKYIKERSSSSPTSSHSSGDLSLNKILEGKTRSIAARMFYETLVLKSRGLIDLKQDQPYSDITLKLTPELSSNGQL
ncbi:PREDICTED: sister chromatid cohesion 1 protein 3-like [Camelina sativa]|uniref:Sister chromatid cohesion 1 protein 3-like n=1 Tax=Camelina sativa TaxID=90675 RepID=A0ABM0TD94_CAMSA|nr:PREDICTED: sister chromatid cohesion 1 protein 3-like [Camelina sativa]